MELGREKETLLIIEGGIKLSLDFYWKRVG